ncbi:GGDEF domain-containing protein [Alkanindiges illinoisensis]|uniref:GGDEF domain-containing protein n=1 Tax=Alkanindiges illinoisensis TaxID=197183 RepID=UPI000479F4A1|nr:sensor domain-containing diguanylate cyclase [Alkanindiges illinoisensis]
MNVQAFASFEEAGRAVLRFLHERFGFTLWAITRVESNNLILLQAEDHGYGLKPGQIMCWANSLCSLMVAGQGPRIAPKTDDVAIYAQAPITQRVPIKAYVGQPIVWENGELFGTLCALDPMPQPDEIKQEETLFNLLGSLLSHILQNELKQQEQSRKLERFKAEALTDELTQLYNRRGWEQLLQAEEERNRRYGHSSAIYVVDLDGLKEVNDTCGHLAGDELIRQTAQILRHSVRTEDVVARLGGDEFAILTIETSEAEANALKERIQQALIDNQIEASIGVAIRLPATGLKEAFRLADQQMYAHKRSKQNQG